MIKRVLALFTGALVAFSAVCAGGARVSAVSGATGVGLAEHAMTAYYENWSYVYGGSSAGAVDCSGLFVTYKGVGGNRTNLLGSSSESGSVSNGIPRIHGLGLWQPGHVGIYVGGGMAVDARDERSDIVYHNVSSKSWQKWFKVAGVNYPTTGWQTFEGNQYYYENGEYIVNCTRVIDGKTYTFNSSGVANGGSTATADQIAAAEAKKKAEAEKQAAAAAAAKAEAEAAEKAAAEKAAAEQKAKEEEEAKKKAEEEAKKKAEEEAAAKKKAEEEAAAKAAEEKAAAETAADEQGELLAQSLLTDTVPLEEKSIPRVKAAVVPQIEEQMPENAGSTAFVMVIVVFLASGMFFLIYQMKHTVNGRSYVPALDLSFAKQISRRMEKALTEKSKKLLKK